MRDRSELRLPRPIQLLTAAFLLALPLPAFGHEAGEPIPEPGFRPDSAYAPAFLDALDTVSIAVYPTIIRRADRTAHSFASQDQIIAALSDEKMATIVSGRLRIDLGRLPHASQWDLFQNSMLRIADKLRDRKIAAKYHLFMELLFPVDQTIFGIHCFVLDRDGENAFSFLLNSHHRIFFDAHLTAKGKSLTAHNELIENATRVAVVALAEQLAKARERAALAPIVAPERADAGIFDDFEAGLPKGTDKFGIPVGFVEFTDGRSDLRLSATSDYPTRAGEVAGNKVLRLDFDINAWAAFAHIFENKSSDAWIAYDWSEFDKFSFWLYGNNSGAALFVDILDNRNTWSTSDDAERFVYNFRDDFSGWRQVIIDFESMRRKDVGNGAPNDGLGLLSVHGWAFGTAGRSGGSTYFIDDFELHTTPVTGGTFFHENPIKWPPAKGRLCAHAAKIEYPINELPMYGLARKTREQQRADETYIETMTRGGRSREDAAQSAARLGWNSYYAADCPNAMRRFNQAWLLDPDNRLALWGFAVVSLERGDVEQATRYFQMAIEAGPEDPSLQQDYETALSMLD